MAGNYKKEMRMKARKKMIESMRDDMSEMDGEGMDMSGMKKVSVMAKNKEGLEEGLDKAKEILKAREMENGKMMNDDYMDYDDYSKEELIKMLKDKKMSNNKEY